MLDEIGESMKKKIFISHSSLDENIANFICNSLERECIGCWIAPRDIPYGNDWAGEITEAIKDSSLFLLILSENSNLSRQCPKELSVADKIGLPIICIKLNDVEMNSGFEYHLSMSHIMNINSQFLSEETSKLIGFIKSKLDEITLSKDKKRKNDTSINVDKELKKHFDKLQHEKIETGSSFLKLYGKNYVDNAFLDEKVIESNIPVPNNTEIISVLEKSGEFVLAFVVKETIDPKTRKIDAYFEELNCTKQTLDSGVSVCHFHIIHQEGQPMPLEEKIVFLTINRDGEFVTITNGVTLSPKIKISQNVLKFNYGIPKKCFPTCNYVCNDFFEFTEDFIAENFSKYIIIDPDNGEIVKRKRLSQNSSSSISLKHNKSYFCFYLETSFYDDNETTASTEQLALGYCLGIYGLPKDVLKAAELFDSCDSPDSLFWLSMIFENDSLLKNEERYYEYSEKAALAGHKNALSEYAANLFLGMGYQKNVEKAREIVEELISLNPNDGYNYSLLALFHRDTNIKKSAELYLKAANLGVRSAFLDLATISLDDKGKTINYEKGLEYLIISQFLNIKDDENLMEEYKKIFSSQKEINIIIDDIKNKIAKMDFCEEPDESYIIESLFSEKGTVSICGGNIVISDD